jgi:muramoyltetrapeptide carboxypeptidase LdcA involved in peptidoglycan recycling
MKKQWKKDKENFKKLVFESMLKTWHTPEVLKQIKGLLFLEANMKNPDEYFNYAEAIKVIEEAIQWDNLMKNCNAIVI